MPVAAVPQRPALLGGDHAIGERRLLLAVLEEAVTCFQTYLYARNASGRRLFLEAEQWLRSGDSEALCSFESICTVLGIDADYIRHGLDRWRERKLETVAE